MKKLLKRLINKIIYRQQINLHGKNNKFICPKSVSLKKIKINIWGNNNLINVGRSIMVGDNVWICKDVRLMKNTNIPNGCIVTKNFDKENCVIAGNPARIVKENVFWAGIRPNDALKEICK